MTLSVDTNGKQAPKQAQQVVVVQGSICGKPLNDISQPIVYQSRNREHIQAARGLGM